MTLKYQLLTKIGALKVEPFETRQRVTLDSKKQLPNEKTKLTPQISLFCFLIKAYSLRIRNKRLFKVKETNTSRKRVIVVERFMNEPQLL